MSSVDVENLLRPVSESDPCGPSLSGDGSYLKLEESFRPRQVAMIEVEGDDQKGAAEPDWEVVRDLCVDLLGRSKDLVVAVRLAYALLCLDGLEGLRRGLALIRGLLERYWEGIHPRLDREEGDDPVARINVLANLSPRVSDPANPMDFLERLKKTDARDSDPGDAALADSCTELDGITRIFAERAVGGQTPDLSRLRTLVVEMKRPRQSEASNVQLENTRECQGSSLKSQASGLPTSDFPLHTSNLQSRQEALAALAAACRYFEQAEPASPLPLLLRRARRLASLSFVDLVRDLCPEGLPQVESIAGTGA